MWQGLRGRPLRRLLRHVKSVHSEAKLETPEKQINFHPGNCFKTLYPWKSKDEFSASLIKSVFFNHDGLIALNKPYGVAVHKQKANVPKTKSWLNRSCFPETKYCVEDAVPALKEEYNLNHLEIMKCTERFTTGICIFATGKSTVERVKNAIKRPSAEPYQTYWAVTRGSLSLPMACATVGLKMVDLGEHGIEPEIIWEPSQRHKKLKLVKSVKVEHRVLSSNHDYNVSLCEVSTQSNKSHFVRLYCIQRSSCILGDTLYSPRLRSVLGRTVVLSPRNYDKNVDPFPTLKNEVVKSLGLICSPGEEMAHMPVLLHLRSLNLTKWYKDHDLVLTAPVPEHFKWACRQLKLDTYPMTISG